MKIHEHLKHKKTTLGLSQKEAVENDPEPLYIKQFRCKKYRKLNVCDMRVIIFRIIYILTFTEGAFLC